MKKLGTGIKLIPYAFEFKTNLFFGALLLVIGILTVIGENIGDSDRFGSMIGPLYLVLGPLMGVQLCYTMLMSQMIGASPKRKLLDVVLPNVLNAVTVIVAFSIVAGIYSFNIMKSDAGVDNYIKTLFYAVILIGIIEIYFAVCYRGFLLSSIVLFITYMLLLILMNSKPLTELICRHFEGNWTRAIVECSILLIISILVSGLIRRALYKVAISSYCGGFKLRKIMQ